MNKKTVLFAMTCLWTSGIFAADTSVQKEAPPENKLPKEMISISENPEYDQKIRNSFHEFISVLAKPMSVSDELNRQLYENHSATVIYLDDKIISYRIYIKDYFGGCHENYSTLTGTIIRHPSSGRPREMKLSDIVTVEQLPKMQKLIMEAFKKEMIAKGLDKNTIEEKLQKHFKSWNKPKPKENFYYDAHGLHFVYNPYELSAFGDGDFDLCIQWPLPKCVTPLPALEK